MSARTGLGQFLPQRRLRRGKDLVQRRLNAVADRAGPVRRLRVRRKRLLRFHRLIDFGQRDASRRTAKARPGACAFTGRDESRRLQQKEQPPNDDGVGVDAACEQCRRDRLAFFICENSQDMHGYSKSTTCSHGMYVTDGVTFVKCACLRLLRLGASGHHHHLAGPEVLPLLPTGGEGWGKEATLIECPCMVILR